MIGFLGTVLGSAIALFVIVEPVGALPAVAALMGRRPRSELPKLARRAAVTGALVLAAFAVAGRALLAALGLSVDAIRAAGGLVLLLTALDMLRGRQPRCRCTPEEVEGATGDVAIVPLAVPLLAGPGAIATVITLAGTGGESLAATLLAVVLVFAVAYVILRSAAAAARLVGPVALSAIERVFGLVLAAMSAQLLASGLRGLIAVGP